MQRREDIQVKPGYEYDHYFPKAKLISITKKKGATVADTLLLIPAVVRETLFHTRRFAQEEMQDEFLEKTCKNIWDFVHHYIAYKKDEDGKEQVRSPARAWHDRHNTDEKGEPTGVDCDCYTVFISSVLSNLNIKHKLRITKYGEDHFQHIYPIVPTGDGGYITIDCVVNRFDYEEPYTEKKDTDMDLEYLNGVNDTSNYKNDSQDFMGLMGEQEALSELGKLFKRKTPEQRAKRKEKIKKFINKGLHVTNRLNPATVALRNGVLAAMKLNFMKIGSNLRYAYLTEDQAREKGLIMDRYQKMKKIKDKLEKIFYGAGGKPENLKKAILTGHGNKNKEVPVNGLGYINENTDGLHEDMPLSQLLGRDIYASENIEGMEGFSGFGELGEPVTAATIAAATTVLTVIAGLIKSVGSMKAKSNGGKNGGDDSGGGGDSGGGDNGGGDNSSSGDNTNNSNTSDNSSNNSSSDQTPENKSSGNDGDESTNGSGNKTNTPATTNSNTPAANDKSGGDEEGDGENNNAGSNNRLMAKAKSNDAKPTFWDNNKKWIKPVGIGVGSLGLLALIYHLLKPKAKPAVNGVPKKTKPRKNLLNGIQSKKKGGNHQPKRKKSKKKTVTLL